MHFPVMMHYPVKYGIQRSRECDRRDNSRLSSGVGHASVGGCTTTVRKRAGRKGTRGCQHVGTVTCGTTTGSVRQWQRAGKLLAMKKTIEEIQWRERRMASEFESVEEECEVHQQKKLVRHRGSS